MKTTAIAFFAVFVLSGFNGLRAAEVCCAGLGCFSDAPPYSNHLFLPHCPEDMSLSMTLFTRENLQGEEISRTYIPTSLKADVMLMFVVHGWTQSEEAEWMHDIKDAALKQGDYNVVVVGWKGGSQNINYFQSASDTRTLGAEIARVAQNAIDQGRTSREKLYCVGHSLGAQVCGFAGRRLKFARITGLDPAAIPFDVVGLDQSCADYVDVIHTHGLAYAGVLRLMVKKAIGHVDFYPNGGELQPGCDLSLGMVGLLDSTKLSFEELDDYIIKILSSAGPVCNHLRAVYFYIESILTPCFVTNNWCAILDLIPVSCIKKEKNPQNMGFHSIDFPGRGMFYLTTNAQTQFCLA